MGKLKKIFLLGVLLVSLASGCASIDKITIESPNEKHFSQSYQTDDTKSFALNVMSAADREGTLIDINRPSDFAVSPNDGAYGTLVETTLTAGAWTALTGAGQLMSVATIGKTRLPSDYPQIFAWIPKNLVGTKKGAEDLLLKELMDSVKSRYKAKGYVEHVYENLKTGAVYEGKNCSNVGDKVQKNQCNFTIFSHLKIVGQKRATTKQMVLTESPSFQNGGESFFTFSGINHGYAVISERFPKPNNNGTLTKRYIEYSKELPSWVYIYLPQRWSSKNEEDYPNLPILINQGEVHYFFKPEAKK